MLAKAARLLGGILLVPACVGYSRAFYGQLAAIQQTGDPALAILLGITAYLAYHVLVSPPARMYVLGHEITQATTSWVSGGEAKAGKAPAGPVALVRYLVPVWAVVWALAFGAAGFFWKTAGWMPIFFFGLGAALALHLVFTVDTLKQKQSDLEAVGPVLSLDVILWASLAWIVGILAIVLPDVHFGGYLMDGLRKSGDLYQAIFTQLFIR